MKTIQQGGKNFAALPGSGKQEDEQEALLDVISGVLMGKWGSAGTILLKHILKDYLIKQFQMLHIILGGFRRIHFCGCLDGKQEE